MFTFRNPRVVSAAVLLASTLVLTPPAAWAATSVVSGAINSGSQFDLYLLPIRAGSKVGATLVCDFDGASRPLDPVLSVFFPGSDSSDTIFADVYNDDGFGEDDFPNGVDCDAFDSSRVSFVAPVTGVYTFRADGFGSATGPYTLTRIVADDPVVGTAVGGHVRVFGSGTGGELPAPLGSFFPYPGLTGGVRVAAGDVNGDFVQDVITGAGPGGGPHVVVFDGQTGAVLQSFFAFDAGFTGGVFVAAGDVNGDGKADIVTGAGPGGGPHVKVFDGLTGTLLQSFFPYGVGFTGGVPVAAGDVDADGRSDIIVGAGPGRPPHVRVFDGSTGAEIRAFLAFDENFTGGVFVGP